MTVKPVPMDEYMAKDFGSLGEKARIRWMVTESSQSRMKANSYWPDISESYIRPVERQAGMTTFGTLLKANGRCEDGTGALKAHEQGGSRSTCTRRPRTRMGPWGTVGKPY